MQNYPVRTSHRKNLALPPLEELLRTNFDHGEVEGDAAVSSYGAISRIAVRPVGRDLGVEVVMNPKVPEDVAKETIRRYNLFLEAATGFSSKERAKRLRKSATSSGA